MSQTRPENDFELMFESAPISLWLEDYSALKRLFDDWRAQGITDLSAHLAQTPALVKQCAACLKVIKVNRQTLSVFAAIDQQELVQRLADVFRDDTLGQMLLELELLWAGTLEFSNRTVNYALDGRRIDVFIHVRVLPGYESTWERVMVSLEDITPAAQAQHKLSVSEHYARNLFDYSPVSLWVEDFSGVKRLLDDARSRGIRDFRVFISVHPDFVSECMEEIRVINVNQQTLSMFAAESQDELVAKLGLVFRDEMQESFAEQLIDLWDGKTVQMREVVNYSLSGELINIHMQFAVLPNHQDNWDLVLVSLIDITARKKAEAYLEYLGKHDALTKLRNRAFYVDELNRISRKGPWPLTVMAMDLNGLKRVNDTEGHAAGDAILRRAGEVLANATVGQPYCVARIGGDEFVALLPGSDERLAVGLQERIQSMIDMNNQFYPGQRLNMAIGIASASSAAQVEAALMEADQAMFRHKTQFYEESKLERRRMEW